MVTRYFCALQRTDVRENGDSDAFLLDSLRGVLCSEQKQRKTKDLSCIMMEKTDDENYYMIGFDAEAGKIKHYRVDKMRDIELTDDNREGKEHFKKFDMAAYARMNFGMFGGEEVRVKLQFENDMMACFWIASVRTYPYIRPTRRGGRRPMWM